MRVLLTFICLFFSHAYSGMVVQEKGRTGDRDFPWMTENRYRVVLQCQSFEFESSHRIAWAELDFSSTETKTGLAAQWNPDSIRVIEYDAARHEPVKYDPAKEGVDGFFVPAKIDEWPRKQYLSSILRNPHLSWLRRAGDASNAIYICYFDVLGEGESKVLAKPAYIGAGDALAYGIAGRTDIVRGLPLVFDYDGDGKKDLFGALSTVPERMAYFYKNEGDSFHTAFAKPVKMSNWGAVLNGCRQIADIDGDGHLDAVAISGFFSDVCHKQFTQWTAFKHPPELTEIMKSARLNSAFVCDWDGDGVNDFLLGYDSWKEYGFSDAYDDSGTWTNGPLRGWFQFVKNIGSNKKFKLGPPVPILLEDGSPAEVYGFANLAIADFNKDGLPDLLAGDFVDHITIFKNIGTKTSPKLVTGQYLRTTAGIFEADFQAVSVFVCDYNEDGYVDLLTRGENDAVGLLENTGLLTEDGYPVFKPIRYLLSKSDYLVSPQLPVVDVFDWNGDGNPDVIYGNSPGMIGWYQCTSPYPALAFGPSMNFKDRFGQPHRIVAGANGSIQGPAEAKWGYTVPCAGDWDHDGFPDIMLNSAWGKIVWFRNPGEMGSDVLENPSPVCVEWPGAAPKPAWTWWTPETNEWVTQWRSNVRMMDWDGDGLLDAVALDSEGYLVLHRRYKEDGVLKLGSGERIFRNWQEEPWRINSSRGGGSGRRKFAFTDWDGDGDWDLIVDRKEIGGNVCLYENVADNSRPKMILWDSLADIIVEGHTCSPAVMDIEGDGKPDLLMAAEDGHFYCFHRSYIEHKSRLQASFVENGVTCIPNNRVTLFDDDIVTGKLSGADVVTDMSYSGRASIFKQNDSNNYFAITLDLQGGIEVLDGTILEARINFDVDPNHISTDLKCIQLYTYNGYKEPSGTAKYYPDAKDGLPAAVFMVDGKAAPPVNYSILFDQKKDTWQLLQLDLTSGPGMQAVNTIRPSSILREVRFVFKNPCRVYIDDIRIVPAR